MSFKIDWDCVEKESFTQYAKSSLNDAMNSGKRPNILSDGIKIVDLNFGSIPPDFEILEIGDLGKNRFRGIFKFNYSGDSSVTLTTKVSASLLKNYNANITDAMVENTEPDYQNSCQELAGFVKPKFVVSDCNFDIPLYVTLSGIKMSSIIVVVFSVSKGLTLVFKNEPLESIEVNSTFDQIKPIARFLQERIETQIGELFKEFLPSMLYKFSLEYTTQSFQQFHKTIGDEKEEEEPRVLLKDVDADSLMGISPGSLMRLTRLASSRQTLALGGELSCDRMNADIVTKAFMNAILASSNTFAFSKLHLSDSDFSVGPVGDKVKLIKDFQARTFWKSSHDEAKPRRRVLHWHRHKKNQEEEAEKPEVVAKQADQSEETLSEDSETTLYNSTPATVVPEDAIADITDTRSMLGMKLKAGNQSTLSISRRSPRSSNTSYADDSKYRSIPLREGNSSMNTSNVTVIPTGGSSTRTSSFAYSVDEGDNSERLTKESQEKQIESLRQKLREKFESQRSDPSNIYHIDKDERMKIKSRIAKLDRILTRKNAGNYEYEVKKIPSGYYGTFMGHDDRTGFDTPPPPYSYA